MKGGLGSAAIALPNGLVVGAIVAVNAAGDVIDPSTGKVVAGVRTEDGKALADVRAAAFAQAPSAVQHAASRRRQHDDRRGGHQRAGCRRPTSAAWP